MDKRIAWTMWTIHALVVCASIVHGGMWLDEMQVWGLAWDSDGLTGLLHLLRNEGHPPLWPLLVKVFATPFGHPVAMAVLHGLFASGAAWLLLFRAPWPLLWRVLAVCGYFVLFEYAVNVRNYGPGMFFLFAALAAHRSGKHRAAMGLFMALALTHYWGIIVAGAWAVVMIASRDTTNAARGRLGLVLAMCAVALFLCVPAAELPYTPSIDRITLSTLPGDVGRMLGQAFLPFPDLMNDRPWNTNWLLHHAPDACAVLGFVCLGAMIWTTSGNKRWTIFLLIAVGGIMAFPVLAPFRSVRYYGPVVLAFLAALWMAPPTSEGLRGRSIVLLLALQVPGGIAMTIVGLRMPKSTAQEAVAWIEGSAFRSMPIAVHPIQSAPALSGYLGHPVFCPAAGGNLTFMDWTRGPLRLETASLLDSLARRPEPRWVLVTDDRSLDGDHRNLRITPLHSFANALIASEEHRMYLVERNE